MAIYANVSSDKELLDSGLHKLVRERKWQDGQLASALEDIC